MDIIHLLPDEVANQIAAGEVVQRPASVVKELVENAIDAGAVSIQVIIKEAGRTLIQVIDDGKGMSNTDARMAFERHATSKILKADDLFALHTMGFRGEALASIAAVAQVELQTCAAGQEMGSRLVISGGFVDSQEPCVCPVGCNFQVKNLFYNVPARRKFLKKNETELSNIKKSFDCIALVYPQISFELYSDGQLLSKLPAAPLRERVVNIMGRNLDSQLMDLKCDTELVRISGFVGKPETAKKNNVDKQFFFVNGRFMKHHYFHKAVSVAYENMVAPGCSPAYFIYFEINPGTIDVNIHPTKTEIKFENEQQIWPILKSAVKEALGRFDAVDALDFNQTDSPDMPSFLDSEREKDSLSQPSVSLSSGYNPFSKSNGGGGSYNNDVNKRNWQSLYSDFEREGKPDDNEVEEQLPQQQNLSLPKGDEFCVQGHFLQFLNKYILTPAGSGLLCIDQHRAHFRILYNQYLINLKNQKCVSQRLLLPEQLELSESDEPVMDLVKDDLAYFGYEVSPFGNHVYVINSVPADNEGEQAAPFVAAMISAVKNEDLAHKDLVLEKMAKALAYSASIQTGHKLLPEEMEHLVNQLFQCPDHQTSPDGKPIMTLITGDEIDKKFGR